MQKGCHFMKNISDYTFYYNSWQLKELNLKQEAEYFIENDLCDLKKGMTVKFIGFDDVDNHYGIFVFADSDGNLLEVRGDFSSPTHGKFLELKQTLSNA
jgi:hypothetical protein